jgi:hypothetical protein
VKHNNACILKQIEESNMKRLPDMTREQPRRDTVALETVHEYPEASTPRQSLFAAIVRVFLPFGAGYVLSYFFPTINALLLVMAVALSLGALILGISAHRLRRRGIRAQDVLTTAAAIFIAAELALILDLHVCSYLLWSIIGILGGASVLTYALIAEYFPPAMIGKANAALTTCHITGAFTLQCAIGVLIDRWAGHAGHFPPIAYRTAFALVVVLQITALAWFAGFDRAVAKFMAAFLCATRRTSEAIAPKCARLGLFSEFLAAMHESRRCQAAREICRFEHLVLEAEAYEARARQAHVQPEDSAVPARPPWRAIRASTLGQAWLTFAHWTAKPSARQIRGKQSS